MILSCPQCETQYFAEDETIGSDGRKVKCPACSHEWFVQPDGGAGGGPGQPRGAHEHYFETLRLRRRKRSKAVASTVWMATGALVACTLVGSIVLRERVVDAWPRSASAFAMIGLPVNRFGLDFENIERSRELRGTMPVLTVRADVRNTSRRTRPAPAVRVGLLDDFGREIAVIFGEVTPREIAPGEAGRFEVVMENPPAESYSLDLRFLPVDEMPAEPGLTTADVGPTEGDDE